jgi:hypothetical protein
MIMKYGFIYCSGPCLLFDRVCSGSTPLHRSRDGDDTCRTLVEHKADVTARNRCPQLSRALLMRVDLTPCAAATATLPCDTP